MLKIQAKINRTTSSSKGTLSAASRLGPPLLTHFSPFPSPPLPVHPTRSDQIRPHFCRAICTGLHPFALLCTNFLNGSWACTFKPIQSNSKCLKVIQAIFFYPKPICESAAHLPILDAELLLTHSATVAAY